MMTYTQQNISRQIATGSGSISLSSAKGNTNFINSSNKPVPGQSAANVLLAVPPLSTDVAIKAKDVNTALSIYEKPGVPRALSEIISTTAAYVTATQGVPITSLVNPTGVTLKLLGTYNSFAPKTSQIGIKQESAQVLNWYRNPTLRGSIAAAGAQA
mgnify:CR=1 FL=1|jgi:hypothetical protein